MQARLGESFAASFFAGIITLTLGVTATLPAFHSLIAAEYTFDHEHVLGTSLRITVETTGAEQAREVEKRALETIDRLELIFSRYRSDSQFMRWQSGELSLAQLSPELLQVLARAEQWRVDTRGAFDPRALELSKLWKERAASGAQPTPDQLKHIVDQLRLPPYHMQGDQLASRRDSCAMSLDAIAKGYILDAVVQQLQSEQLPGEQAQAERPEIASFSIMIGGDVRMLGNRSWNMAIAHPLDAGESSPPIANFQLHASSAMATSGGYRRSLDVAGKKVSHIFDPRTGSPAEALLSATVVAPTAMDADAAATALNVLGPVDGLALIESKPELACLLVLNSGEVVVSKRWRQVAQQNEVTPDAQRFVSPIRMVSWADEKSTNGLHVKFTLARGEGGRYRRPYVAVWLEDKDGFPVKTAVLWLQTDGPGPRWHRDLTRWWADDRLRKLVEDKELIGTVSGATRGPGEYDARFDMTDNSGKALPAGKYTLCLEAAREHGSHHLIREEIELAAKPLDKKTLKGGTEFSAASYSYLPVTAKSSGTAR